MSTDSILYVVTGATGFLGNNIVHDLLRENKKVRCFVRDLAKADRLFEGKVECVVGDINDADALRKALSGDEEKIVIHCAAMVSIGGKKLYKPMRIVNVGGTKNVVDRCIECGVKRLVHVSSVHAITEPKKHGMTYETKDFDMNKVVGSYAKTKAEATAYVMDAINNRGLNAVVVHPSGIVGPYDYGNTYLTKLITDYDAGRIPAGVKGGYNFVDVRDVSYGTIAAAEKGRTGETYLLTGNFVTVREITENLYLNLKKKHVKTMLPMWIAQVGAPFLAMSAKMAHTEPLYTRYALYTLKSNGNFCNDKAQRELGFTARSIEDSIKDCVAFLREEKRL